MVGTKFSVRLREVSALDGCPLRKSSLYSKI